MKTPTFESRVRGLMLGLALGDAVGSLQGDAPRRGTLKAGAGTQLAAFTAEALVLSRERNDQAIDLTFRDAYKRWAAIHGVTLDVNLDEGRLARMPLLAAQRGSSPATTKALLQGGPTLSQGCQALLRSIPIAARRDLGGRRFEIGQVCAGVTHDLSTAGTLAGALAILLGRCLEAASLPQAFERVWREFDDGGSMGARLGSIAHAASQQPCVPDVLTGLAPDKRSTSAFSGGIYVALCFPDADTIPEAMEFAGWAPDGDAVAAVAGAILGAVHGADALPLEVVSRLELGWVMDSLARDLAQIEPTPNADPGWEWRIAWIKDEVRRMGGAVRETEVGSDLEIAIGDLRCSVTNYPMMRSWNGLYVTLGPFPESAEHDRAMADFGAHAFVERHVMREDGRVTVRVFVPLADDFRAAWDELQGIVLNFPTPRAP